MWAFHTGQSKESLHNISQVDRAKQLTFLDDAAKLTAIGAALLPIAGVLIRLVAFGLSPLPIATTLAWSASLQQLVATGLFGLTPSLPFLAIALSYWVAAPTLASVAQIQRRTQSLGAALRENEEELAALKVELDREIQESAADGKAPGPLSQRVRKLGAAGERTGI